MPDQIGAWLLPIARGATVAVSDHETVEYVGTAARTSVPTAPTHCSTVMRWRDRFVPVFELDVLLGHVPSEAQGNVIVLAYQAGYRANAPVHYCGLKLYGAPVHVRVSNDVACEVEQCACHTELSVHKLLLAAFTARDEAVPVLDVRAMARLPVRLDATPLPAVAAATSADPESLSFAL